MFFVMLICRPSCEHEWKGNKSWTCWPTIFTSRLTQSQTSLMPQKQRRSGIHKPLIYAETHRDGTPSESPFMWAINFIWETEKRRIWGKKTGEICLDRQKEKRCILLQKTLMSHKMIEMGGMVWFNLPENGWKGRRQFYKKKSVHREWQKEHISTNVSICQ